MFRSLAVATIGLTLTAFAIAQDAKVGTQPGETLPGPFRVFVVTGPVAANSSAEGLLPEERQNLGDPGRVQKFHDFITRFEVGLAPGLGDEIEPFGGAAYEDNLFRVRRANKAADDLACTLIGIRRARR